MMLRSIMPFAVFFCGILIQTNKIFMVQANFPPETCGMTESFTSRIVGGNEATPGKWPWMAYLQRRYSNSDFSQLCGGMLLSHRWVLSAAHCTIGLKPSQLRVVLGEHNIIEQEGQSMPHAVSKIINHPDYYGGNVLVNDISLIELAGEAKFSNFIHPICLPEQGKKVAVGTLCWISGWGETQNALESGNILRDATVPVLDTSNCSSTFPGLEDQHLCASNESSGVDSCQGDSGGPLFCKKDETSPYVARGITSFGIGCSGHGIYTRISEFVNWIQNTINDNLDETAFYSIPPKPCGSVIEGDDVFRLPVDNYTQLYQPNLNCTWIIRPNKNVTRVFLNFVERFAVQTDASSCADYVEVTQQNGNAIRSGICGHDIPKGFAILTDTNASDIIVTFLSDNSNHFEGFALNVTFDYENITVKKCTPTIIKINGTETNTNSIQEYFLGNDVDCYYEFKADQGYLISLEIDADMEECCDYIEVFDGSTSLGRISGYVYNKMIISTGNIVRLRIVTDFSIQSWGFTVSYSQFMPSCGEELTANSTLQNFTYTHTSAFSNNSTPQPSIALSNGDLNNHDCVWVVTASSSNEVIAFVVYDLQLTSGGSVKVVDNFNELVSYIGNVAEEGVISAGNKINILLRSTSTGTIILRAGYFTTKICAQEEVLKIKDNSYNVITSPGYPLATARNIRCKYVLETQFNNILEIKLEGDLGRCCDYIIVYDDDYNFFRYYYNSLENITILTEINRINLEYVTYSYSSYSDNIGFKATYRQINNSCGSKLMANLTAAYITSPGFPMGYQSNSFCYWTITAPYGQHVGFELIFLNLTSEDNLIVSLDTQFSRTYTGLVRDVQSLVSLDSILRIQFVAGSNQSGFEYGFNSSYKLVDLTTFPEQRIIILPGNNFSVLASPNFPLPSPNNVNISYLLQAGNGSNIEIILNVDLEQCCDYLQVIEEDRSVRRLSGKISNQVIVTRTNNLKLEYFTDSFAYSNGFQASYREITLTCGEVLEATNVTQYFSSLDSLNYDYYEIGDENCWWFINNVPSSYLYFEVTSNDLQNNTFLLEIESDSERLIQTSDATRLPFSATLLTQALTVHFYQHANSTTGHINVKYASVGICGIQQFNLSGSSSGMMSSTNYPFNYPDNLDCFYEFYAEPGYKVEITLEGDTEGCCDFVEVYDGMRSLGKLRGIFSETKIISSEEYLGILFYTDSSVTYRGFSAKYRQIMVTCGSNLVATNQSQSIAVSEQPYDTQSAPCIWFISAPLDYQVVLRVEHVKAGFIQVIDGLTNVVTISNASFLPNTWTLAIGLLQIRYEFSGDSGFNASYYSIDPCSNLCDSNNGYCHNFSSGYSYCRCRDGFSGNGYYCEDIDECNQTGWDQLCNENAFCNNTVGNYTCICNRGYVGDGQTCVESEEIPQIVCPNATHGVSSASAWICEYIKWRVEFGDWLKLFNLWRIEHHPSAEIPSQSCQNLHVTCSHPNQKKFYDSFNCSIPYCADGYYNCGPYLAAWQEDSIIWNQFFRLWKDAVDYDHRPTCA